MIGRTAPNQSGRRTGARGRLDLARSTPLLLALAALAAAASAAQAQAPRPGDSPTRPPKARIGGIVPASPTEAPEPMGAPAPGDIVTRSSRPGAPARPPVDDQVVPAGSEAPDPAAEAGEGNPLPLSTAAKDGAAPASAPAGGDAPEPFALQPDRYPAGRPSQVKLSVEVKAPAVINLNKQGEVRIAVKNEGDNDVLGVEVVYKLPDGLEFVSSEAKYTKDPGNPAIFVFTKSMMAAYGEWSIGLKVKATANKHCEHVAAVSARAGSKAASMVQEPKLKVDATVSPGRVQKGKQVIYSITVSNPGTGPAREVTVQAKLSDGLKADGEDTVELVIDEIGPGKSVTLDPLPVDTMGGGQQSCQVEARSPDVVALDEHKFRRDVEVTYPELKVKLDGQDSRFTGQPTDYKLAVTNTGTAATKAVQVVVTLPTQGGRLARVPADAKFTASDRKLNWTLPRLEPGQTFEKAFVYDTSTPGYYRCTLEAVSGDLKAAFPLMTDVKGIADLDLNVSQTDRVIDVSKTTYYDFVITNLGSKEATGLLLGGKLVNLKVVRMYAGDAAGQGDSKPESNGQPAQFAFPKVARLGPGEKITLSLEVEALRGPQASAEVALAHDEMGNDEAARIKGAITTRVTNHNGPAARTAGTASP